MNVNAYSGIITTETASTASGACQAFPFTNNKIAATDVVQIAINAYSGTFGANGIPTVAISAISAGSVTIQVCNMGSNALSGTLQINFVVLKQVD